MEELLTLSTAANSVELGLHTLAKARAKWRAKAQLHRPAVADDGSERSSPSSQLVTSGTRSHSYHDLDDDDALFASGYSTDAVPLEHDRSFSPTGMAQRSLGCIMSARQCYRSCMLGYPNCYRWCVRIPFGVVSTLLYYADVLSDVMLAQDLFATHNPVWGSLTVAFIVVQYAACYVGVLLYIRTVYGACHCYFVAFALLGFPLGPLVLDVLMFLEPLTLLWCLCCSQLRYLLPAYRATRTLIEVTLEGMPQSILQLYIFARIEGFGPPLSSHASDIASISIELLMRSLVLSLLSFTKVRACATHHAPRACTICTRPSHNMRPSHELARALAALAPPRRGWRRSSARTRWG